MTEEMEEIQAWLSERDYGVVDYMEHYADNGDHIRISISGSMLLTVSKGEDPFVVRGFGNDCVMSKPHLWYVDLDQVTFIEKGFVCYKKAVTEAIKKARLHLVRQLAEMPVV